MEHPLENRGKKQQQKQVQSLDEVGTSKTLQQNDVEKATKQTGEAPEVPEATETPEVPSIDDIFATIENKPKKKNKKPITVYLDTDVITRFNEFGKKYGKGAKSELLNTFLRSKFFK